mmetsp:Transcript_108329/g.170847  ORF Transcript_108329/g.170847 Transcript_108329/m.170847 type:complete len:296 (-) Transcript_108329:1-888(-)
MIYICEAPGKICQAGCGICSESCKACSGACDFVNKECGDNFASLCKVIGDNCGHGCSGILEASCSLLKATCYLLEAIVAACLSLACSFIRLDQPLGPFMLLSLVVNLPAAYNGLLAMSQEEVLDCRKAPLEQFVSIDFAIAIVHILFAAYLKHQVIYGYRDPDAVDILPIASNPTAELPMPTSIEVGARVRRIALYDIGFCGYFFVLFGSFGYQFYGFDYGHRCDLTSWRTWNMTTLLMLYPFLAMMYTFFFLCFTGVKGGIERVRGHQPVQQAAFDGGALYVGLASAPAQPAMR